MEVTLSPVTGATMQSGTLQLAGSVAKLHKMCSAAMCTLPQSITMCHPALWTVTVVVEICLPQFATLSLICGAASLNGKATWCQIIGFFCLEKLNRQFSTCHRSINGECLYLMRDTFPSNPSAETTAGSDYGSKFIPKLKVIFTPTLELLCS